MGQSSFVSFFENNYNAKSTFLNGHCTTILERPLEEEHFLTLKDELGFIYLIDLFFEDSFDQKTVSYLLFNLENQVRLHLMMPLIDRTIVDVSRFWEASTLPQLEGSDLFGLKFKSGQTKRVFYPENFQGHVLEKTYVNSTYDASDVAIKDSKYFRRELLKNRDDELFCQVKKLRPSHPIFRNNFLLYCKLREEVIEDSCFEIGYMHRAIEKISESFDCDQVFHLSSKLNYYSPVMGNMAYCHLFEESFQINIPEKAQALRIIFIELSRMSEHFLTLSVLSFEAKNEIVSNMALRGREAISSIFEDYGAHRSGSGILSLGGIRKDLSIGWIADCLDRLQVILKICHELFELITRDGSWFTLLNDHSLSSSMALGLSLSGPNLRACGISHDLRKVNPIYFYGDLDFEVPLGIDGTSYDRVLVRFEEIKQSAKIIGQLLDNLPSGNISLGDLSFEELNRKDIGKNKIFYSSIESSNGELGFYMNIDKDGKINRFRPRCPSYYSFQGIGEIFKGSSFSKANCAFASLNIVMSEVDK